VKTHAFVRTAVVALSFIAYALAVASLHQERAVQFAVEEDGPIPVALSHRLFGSPLGLIDSGLTDYFRKKATGISAEVAVEQAVDGAATETHALAISSDGTGVGGFLAADAAFSLFGPHARSLPIFFLLAIGISVALFTARYQDDRVLAVPVLLLAFTVLLLTPVSAPANAAQAPIGGIRYYAIAAIIPALHWCLEFASSESPSRRDAILRWLLLGGQIAILTLAILIRASSAYLIGAAILSAAYCAIKRRDRAWLRPMLAAPCAAIFIALFVAPALSFPDYASKGRAGGVVWHRVFISLGSNPSWPFAGLRDVYICPEIPEGLVPSIVDRNGHCVWLHDAQARGISLRDANDGLYGRQYEEVMRSAFFYVAASYPLETFKTFFYFKPQSALRQIANTMRFDVTDATRAIALLVILQFVAALAFILSMRIPSSGVARCTELLGLFLVLSLAPQFVAWTTPSTAVDLFAYLWCACATASLAVITFACRRFVVIRRSVVVRSR